MAKEGIDGFFLDCHTNEKLAEIEGEYGIKGFAVIVRLWQKIYSERGYYCEWIDKSAVLFLSMWFGGNSGVDGNFIEEVVTAALRIGIFDMDMYERYSILTSDGVQRRFFLATKRRRELKVVSEYLLVSFDDLGIDVSKNITFVNINAKNACNFQQRKVKERKVNESKGKEESRKKKDTVAAKPQGLSHALDEMDFSSDLKGVIKEWLRYKAEKHDPYKETGFKYVLANIRKKADQYGEDAVAAMIRDAMSNNWKGFHLERLDEKKQAATRNDKIANRVSEVDSW